MGAAFAAAGGVFAAVGAALLEAGMAPTTFKVDDGFATAGFAAAGFDSVGFALAGCFGAGFDVVTGFVTAAGFATATGFVVATLVGAGGVWGEDFALAADEAATFARTPPRGAAGGAAGLVACAVDGFESPAHQFT